MSPQQHVRQTRAISIQQQCLAVKSDPVEQRVCLLSRPQVGPLQPALMVWPSLLRHACVCFHCVYHAYWFQCDPLLTVQVVSIALSLSNQSQRLVIAVHDVAVTQEVYSLVYRQGPTYITSIIGNPALPNYPPCTTSISNYRAD